MQNEIQKELYALSDENFQKFSKKLIPNAIHIIGVRLPNLRKLAKQIAKSDWENYLRTATNDSLEEVMLQGLVVGYVQVSIEKRLFLIKNFVPKINNWAICDTFCGTLKFSSEDKSMFWNFLQSFFQDNRPYFIRFGIIMLFKFIDEDHIDSIFSLASQIHMDHRYVKLAIAWLIAECCVLFPKKTIAFLQSQKLDLGVQKMATRKIAESSRIEVLTKKEVDKLKR